MKDVVVLIGAGLIGQAIVRRVGYGRHLVVGDLAAFITGADFLIDGGTTRPIGTAICNICAIRWENRI